MKELKFKKFKWVVVKEKTYISGCKTYFYRVYRKYFRAVYLYYTKQSYEMTRDRWDYHRKRLEKNPNYNYTMSYIRLKRA